MKSHAHKLPVKSQIRKLKLYALSLIDDLYAGGYRSVAKGQGLEISDSRPYLQSDEVRFIDWNVTARFGETYVKTFCEEKELRLQLVVDNSLSLYAGSSSICKRDIADFLVVLFSYIAQMNNDPVGALFFDEKMHSFKARKGAKYLNCLIQFAIERTLAKGSDLAKALRTILEDSRKRSMVVIISDFKMDEYFKELCILTKYHDVMAIRLSDELDEDFPSTGLVDLQDPETGECLQAWGQRDSFTKRYHDFSVLQRLRWRKVCLKRNIATLEVNTQEDYFKKVKHFLKQKRKRRS